MPEVQARWQADVARQAALPERSVAWPEALGLLETNNLKLRAARVDITNAQELASQVFRDLIPTINLRSGATRSIKNIPATSFDDVTFNIDSFFNVPGVVNFDSRWFAGRLTVLRAKAAYQLERREQTIELYKLFLEAREEQEIANELKSERTLATALQQADEWAGQIMLKEIESQQLVQAKSRESLQTRIGEILGDGQYRWVLRSQGLPDFQYENVPLPLGDTNRVAQLQMKLVALELVRAWAQIHGIKLQYWPELTIFVSGPSAFQRVNGQSHFWSSAEVTATADFFWTLDTRGYVGQQLRQTRREQELEAARLRQDTEELIDRLLAAQRLASSLRREIEQLDQLIGVLESVPQNLDLDSVLQAAENNRSLRYQRFKLRRDLAEVNALFWFVDEQKWASVTP
ncbi:MAG: hypothetical protein JWR19_3924 [Pedosphaera sp.]|nr:hypothetical protein [Pedosphaera sp.]